MQRMKSKDGLSLDIRQSSAASAVWITEGLIGQLSALVFEQSGVARRLSAEYGSCRPCTTICHFTLSKTPSLALIERLYRSQLEDTVVVQVLDLSGVSYARGSTSQRFSWNVVPSAPAGFEPPCEKPNSSLMRWTAE